MKYAKPRFGSDSAVASRRRQDLIRVVKLSSYIRRGLPGVGGGEIQTHALALALREVQVDVRVIDTRGQTQGRSVERLDGIPVLRFRSPGFPVVDAVRQQMNVSALLCRLKGRCDLVQVNHLSPAILPAIAFARRAGVPLVLVLWGSCRPGVGPFRKGPKWSLLRVLARRVDCVIALSRSMAESLVDTWDFPAELVTVIPNGVDTERYRPGLGSTRPDGMAFAGPMAISVGRLTPAKRFDVLIHAWKNVVSRHADAHLVLVGDGELRQQLEELSRDLGIAGRVHLVGMQRDVNRWLAAADVYVSSSDTEGMSNALLEAMSSGLPVAATRVSGSEELVVENSTGFLASPGNTLALEDAILRLLDDPEGRVRMGLEARRKVEMDFSLPSVAKAYRSCYEQLLRGRQRPQ